MIGKWLLGVVSWIFRGRLLNLTHKMKYNSRFYGLSVHCVAISIIDGNSHACVARMAHDDSSLSYSSQKLLNFFRGIIMCMHVHSHIAAKLRGHKTLQICNLRYESTIPIVKLLFYSVCLYKNHGQVVVWRASPFARERKGLVSCLYEICTAAARSAAQSDRAMSPPILWSYLNTRADQSRPVPIIRE